MNWGHHRFRHLSCVIFLGLSVIMNDRLGDCCFSFCFVHWHEPVITELLVTVPNDILSLDRLWKSSSSEWRHVTLIDSRRIRLAVNSRLTLLLHSLSRVEVHSSLVGHFFMSHFGNTVRELYKLQSVHTLLANILVFLAKEGLSGSLKLRETLVDEVLVSVDITGSPLTELIYLSLWNTLIDELLPSPEIA